MDIYNLVKGILNMNIAEIDRIKTLYINYGFEVEDDSNSDEYISFVQRKSYFRNIEILVFDKKYDISSVLDDYQKAGYSTRSLLYSTFDSLHKSLYEGFFDIGRTRAKLHKNYLDYCNSQTKKNVCSKYQYIPCNYLEGDNTNRDSLINKVVESMLEDNASLTIIEAPAGFGKTCTSYEILNCFIEKSENGICMLAELSKNRNASLFRYVLYSEIDRIFSGLSYDLVTSEIKGGNLPIIIDGFDEILSKSINESDSSLSDNKNEAQNMLNTIASLLSNNSKAKIVLTSRKSSIFTGELFDTWIGESNLFCDIYRYELSAPNVVQWIGNEKAEILKEEMPELFYSANPILLSTISKINIEDFKKGTEYIINYYFDMILLREKERQSLVLEKEEQIEIMSKLAAYFVDFDISAEDKSLIKDMITEITLDSIDLYISRYSLCCSDIEKIPTKEEFIMKLVHHAFLDRVYREKNEIGFINEFTFGYLIGIAITKQMIHPSKLGYKYLDLMFTSYQNCNYQKRNQIYNLVKESMYCLEAEKILLLDSKMIDKSSRTYENESFHELSFKENFSFDIEEGFTQCTFFGCNFWGCTINVNAFHECQFYNCRFEGIKLFGKATCSKKLSFFKCIGNEQLASMATSIKQETHIDPDYERLVLEQFWKPGKDKADILCGLYTVYRGINNNENVQIEKAIDTLIQKHLIEKKHVCYKLNLEHMAEIRAILKR